MTMPFSTAVKQTMVARLTAKNALSAAQLARETGIKQQNLSGRLDEVRNLPIVEFNNSMTACLEDKGVKFVHNNRWRLAHVEAREESLGVIMRIRRLTRELARREKALAEAAALLVLRESIESRFQDEGDNTDDQIEVGGLNDE